ncbi:isocitrate lyase/phosphoenolpyruvate mutase family protein [Marine Group I thaumarchaeote]|uniref:Isocitrate lyase/phosphoenolpyruvate mutase family protein n=1 Tax=Marine Group I thaumarchaeote TaxID=2511932 RepID=A0A7K4NKD3_9ARCH|nr:isocitrate lyase/phosphoenolpyruvate mutase family protein [Marine Group I thaumarchaeote]
MSQSENLVKLLDNQPIVKVCGAYDAMSAKLVELSGFDAVWAGSFAISAINNVPDASILTMTEFFTAASNMANACEIPVIADCDTGYGDATNVRYMVKKYENAGIAGICIEDKTFPKQNSLLEGGNNQLLSEKDFAAKILAANEAKQNKAFTIIARIEALISGIGIEQALKRAYAYEKAGADLILIHSKKITPEEIFEFSDSWKGSAPLVVIPTTYYSVNVDELIEHKIKMVIYANQTLRAAHFALSKLLKQMKNANNMSQLQNQMSSMEDIFKLQEMHDMKSQEKSIEEKLRKLGYVS